MDEAGAQSSGGSFWMMVEQVWTDGVFGVDIGRVLVALGIFFVFLVLRELLARWLEGALSKLTNRTGTDIDDKVLSAVHEPLTFIPVTVGFFFATEYLQLDGLWAEVAAKITKTLIAFTLFWVLVRLVDPLKALAGNLERIFTPELVNWITKALRIAFWLIGGATILEIWGIQVLPIIAGFGLIGVAVALGAQDLFKNLISGILILAEKRYRVGDWVLIDGVVEGTVKAIGFRSTKVLRFDNAPVYVPNSKFADGAVTNYGERNHRRIYWMIGLEYRTTSAQLEQIRAEIEAYILNDERYLKPEDASLFVRIDGFADSSINLMIYCFTRTAKWGEWLAIKEELLIEVKRIVEQAGSGFAFPSQSLYVESVPEELRSPAPKATRSRKTTKPAPEASG
ncbi:MAG: mechanosensitive ion channel family protein [Pseudomonadota bacterium]